MKYLIGYRPSEVDSERNILDYVLNSEEIHGVEVSFSELEGTDYLSYNLEMARRLKKAGKIYQVHLPEMDKNNLSLLSQLNRVAEITGSSVHAVVHHALGTSIEEDIQMTFEMLDAMYQYIQDHRLNIVLHLENLNQIRNLSIFPKEVHDKYRNIVGRERININRIDEILIHYPHLKFCLDFGHVVSDALAYQLTPLQMERVGNIHIHDANEESDHQLNGTCTDIKITDAFIKSVFNLKHFKGYGVIEVAKVNLGAQIGETIKILEKEIKLMKGKHYSEIVLVNGEQMKRDLAFEDCQACGSKKGEFHQSYCEKEVCPLCGKYLSECNHREGYALDENIDIEVLNKVTA
ncbi:MAG: hypothetical protein JXR88_07720 [Clostridia bacterium]|nr:hypothetical protein [Clostridia bacterium]